MIRTLVLLSILTLLSCTSHPLHPILGTWSMTTGDQSMQFNPDHSMIWVIQQFYLNDTFKATYKLDDSKDPQWLDLYDFNKGLLKGKMLSGLYKRIGTDSLLLDFQPVDNMAEADSMRPKDFKEADKRYFTRIK